MGLAPSAESHRSKTPEGAPNSCYVHFLFDVSSFIPKKEKPEEENLYPKNYKAMIACALN